MKPNQVKFSGLTIPSNELVKSRKIDKPIPSSWKRIHFVIENNDVAYTKILEWLDENCVDKYQAYAYLNPADRTSYVVVVRFKSRNDAIMFKLKDGQNCWKKTN